MTLAQAKSVRSLGEEARAARHTAVLDEAAIEFNRTGVAGASLSAIARRVGLTRASLYNYCSDRQDLAHQCFLRTCALTQRDLNRAAEANGRGIDKLATFMRVALDLDHSPMVALNDVGFIDAARQLEVRAARNENLKALRALLTGGIEDGSLRSCEVDIACQTIWGLLSWAPLSRTWTNNSDETFAIRMSAAIPGMVLDGIAADEAIQPQRCKAIADVLPRVSLSDRNDRLETLARRGSELFNRKGIDGVSLDDVAAALGATKGLVYHYFDTKPAFVAFCYERAFDIYDRIFDAAECEKTGIEASALVLCLNVQAQVEDVHPLSLSTGFDIFPTDLQRKFTERTNVLARRSADLLHRGVKDGSIRALDMEAIALARAGAYSYLAKWLPSPPTRPSSEIASEVTYLVLAGLRSRQ